MTTCCSSRNSSVIGTTMLQPVPSAQRVLDISRHKVGWQPWRYPRFQAPWLRNKPGPSWAERKVVFDSLFRFTKDWTLPQVSASEGKTAPVVVHLFENTHFWPGWGDVLTFMLVCVTCTCYVTSLGWGVLTFMLTRVTCTSYVTSLGWGEVLTFMSAFVTCTCYVTSLGWGVLPFMSIRVTCTCYVTSLGWGGGVNVHVSLRHMHILRHVTGLGGC